MSTQHEAILATNISEWLQRQYPKVLFRYDIADLKLTMPQANRMKKLQGERRGYPDLFIAEPRHGFHGLYIELKKDYSDVFLKDGSYKKAKRAIRKGKAIIGYCDHIQEQAEYHKLLREKGYQVVWGLGFDDTVEKIKAYMSPAGKEKINPNQKELF